MSMIKNVRDYFLACDLIDENERINVDYLGVEAVQYSIDPVPAETIIKRYPDGGTVRQYVFTFGSKEYYGESVLQNIENSGFYEEFANWLEIQTNEGNFPTMESYQIPRRIEAQSAGYLFDAGEDSGRYQIQCVLEYYQSYVRSE